MTKTKKWNAESRDFYLFISPWLFGFVTLTIGPMIVSVGLSFMRWDIITSPVWIGLDNYSEIFFGDPIFWKALKVTTIYTVVSVPLHLLASLLVAMLLNSKVRAVGVWRTIFYMPSLLPAVASSMLFLFIFFKEGLLNSFVMALGFEPQAWLQDSRLALGSLIVMSFWGFGAQMLIFLAGLQNVPQELYEAAEIDGAGRWVKFSRVTVPSLSPIIFFNLVMSIIGTFQVFTQGYLITNGGPDNSTMFYVLYLYKNAFEYFRMGYASAMAWILFIIIMACTVFVFRSSNAWVHYEGSK